MSTLRVSLSSGVSLHIHPWAPSHTMHSVASPRDPEVPRSITTQGTTMDMRVRKPFCEFSKTSHPSGGYKEGFTNELLQLACENRAVDGPSHFPPLTSYQTVQAHSSSGSWPLLFFFFFGLKCSASRLFRGFLHHFICCYSTVPSSGTLSMTTLYKPALQCPSLSL